MCLTRWALAAFACSAVTSAFAIQVVPIDSPYLSGMSGNGRFLMFRTQRYDAFNGRSSVFGSIQPFSGSVFLTYDGQTGFAEGIVGEEGQTQIFKLTATDSVPFSADGGTNATPSGCSADGSVVIGEVLGGVSYPAYRWTNGNPMSYADSLSCISGNGRVLFGQFSGIPTIWEDDVASDLWTDEWNPSIADCSYDGSIAVGSDGNRAFVWKKGLGFQDLGFVPVAGIYHSYATGVNDNGSVITGQTSSNLESKAFIYTNSQIQALADYFVARGANVSDWTFQSARVSHNGEAISGRGTYKGKPMAYHTWIAGQHLTVTTAVESTLAGRSFQGRVSFASVKPFGRRVELSTTAPGITVPSAVWIPANQTVVNFQGQVPADTSAGRFTIKATGDGITGWRDIAVVEPIAGFSLATDRIHGGKSTQCTITLAKPARERTTISLTSGQPGLNLPSPIVIQKGSTQGTGYIGSYGHNDLRSYTIEAKGAFYLPKTTRLYVYPTIGWMTISPTSIKGGLTAQAKIGTTLMAPAMGLNYSLRSLSSQLTVPPSASIAAGNTQTQFAVQTAPVTVTAVRAIEAAAAGVSKTVSITLNP